MTRPGARPLSLLVVLLLAVPAHGQELDATDLLLASDAPLAALSPAEVTRKHELMAGNDLKFFRGGIALYARDLARSRLLTTAPADTEVWLHGDLHLENAAAVQLADGSLAFELVDFDETCRGAFVYDLHRLATSVLLAGGDAATVRGIALSYRDAVHAICSGQVGPGTRIRASTARGLALAALSASQEASRERFLERWTLVSADGRRLRAGPGTAPPSPDRRAELVAAIAAYGATLAPAVAAHELQVLDISRAAGTGVGSLGVERYLVLVRGPTDATDDDVLLEWKRSSASALNAQLPEPPRFPSDAERVVAGSRALTGPPGPDRFLGVARAGADSFLVCELSPSFTPPEVKTTSPKQLGELSADMAFLLARAHVFSDPAPREKARALLRAMGKAEPFADRMVRAADDYTAKVRRDRVSFAARLAEQAPETGITGALGH